MACEDRRFCASTSFRHHRIPPQLLLLYPPLPDTYNDSNHRKLAEHETIVDLLGTPLHRIASSDRERASTVLYKTHVLRQEPPFGCMQATEHNYSVASPLYTLLTIAPYVSRIELLMIAYEFCGNFSVFSPNARSEYILNSAYQQGMIPLGAGWTRVKDTKGRDTNLWKRDPLITMEELVAFSKKTAGMRGSQNLRWAAERMTGVCASPFEAQASMLFGLSRRLGGMGLSFENNARIVLTKEARAIYNHPCCYADIYIEGTDAHPPLDIECQGQSVHDGEAAILSDSDRLAALESMGIQVVPITYRQLSNEDGFAATQKLIAQKLNMRLSPKTPKERLAETSLREEVLIDWNTLAQR